MIRNSTAKIWDIADNQLAGSSTAFGLINGIGLDEDYSFAVIASNEFGDSIMSQPSAYFASQPQAPQILNQPSPPVSFKFIDAPSFLLSFVL